MLFTKIKYGIIISLIVAVVGLGYLYRGELKKGAQLAQEMVQKTATIYNLQSHINEIEEERKRLIVIIDKHVKEINTIQRESKSLRNEIEKLRYENEEVQNWGNIIVPDDIYNKLHITETTNSNSQ